MQNNGTYLSGTARLGYTASEVAGQLVFCAISFYLLKFYTDVFGISAAVAGSILFAARCVDALDAPLWGIVFEKTRSRLGQSRPWFLWLCVPFGVFGVLTFTTPHLSTPAKIAWACITYGIASVLYTGINTPVTSILASLTPDTRERITLTTFRMVGSKAGVLLVNLTLFPLVAMLGRGNDRKGFMLAMPFYALGSIALYLLAFRNLREIVPQPPRQSSARTSFLALRGNGPWTIIFVSSLLFWIAFIARIASAPFFFEYVLHRRDLIGIAASMDFTSLASILCLPWLARRLTKRTLWAGGLLASMAAQFVAAAGVASLSVPLVMTGWIAGFVASGIAMAMPFSLLSDSVDYGEWKTGVRAAGLLTAVGAAFCLKAGSGIGAALPGWLLAATHYVPNTQQTEQALAGIRFSFLWLPALCYCLAAVPVLFYARYERMEPAIQRELQQRRAAAALMSEAL